MASETPPAKERRKTSNIVTICIAAGVAIGILTINLADLSFGDGALGAALTGGIAGAVGAALGAIVGIGIERMTKRS